MASTEDEKDESIKAVQAHTKELRKFAEDLIWVLGDLREGPARNKVIREVTYIHSVAQGIISATGITESVLPSKASIAAAHPKASDIPSGNTPDATPAGDGATTRRLHSDAFDLMLLTVVFLQPQLNYNVSLDILHRIAVAFDPACQRPSLTSKLARWKKTEVLRWRDSREIYLSTNGETTRQGLIRRCRAPGGRLDEVAATIHRELGLDPKFD
jgi:hypothetical protein